MSNKKALFVGYSNMLLPMVANIPFCLSENLAPKEVGELLTAAEERKCPPEDIIVFALRDFLAARREARLNPTGGAGSDAVAQA